MQADSSKLAGMGALYRFLGGAALATLLLGVPYLIAPIALTPRSIGLAILLISVCGILTSRLGSRFGEVLASLMNASGLY